MNSNLDFNASQEEKSILNQIVTQALQNNQTASLKDILTSYDYFLSIEISSSFLKKKCPNILFF